MAETFEDVFEPIDSAPPASDFEPIETEATISETPLSTRLRLGVESLAPGLLSTEENPLTEKPRGAIPALYQSAKDYLVNNRTPLENWRAPETQPDDSGLKKVGLGAADFGIGTAQFLTSPAGIATAGIASLGPLARRGIAAFFAPQMTKHGAEALGEASVTGDPRKATEGALVAATAGLAAKHAGGGLGRVGGAVADTVLPARIAEPLTRERSLKKTPVDERAVIDPEALPEKPVETPKPEDFELLPIDAITTTPPTILETKPSKAEPIAPKIETVEPPIVDPLVEPAFKSVGAKSPSDVGELSKSNLAQLNDAIGQLAIDAPDTSPKKAFEMGKVLEPIKDDAVSALAGLKAAGAYLSKKFEGKPVWDKWKDIIGDRHLALSESALNARKYVHETSRKIKDEKLREAISNYIDTGGDMKLLEKGAKESPSRYRPGYERAMKLTPEEKLLADHVKSYFEARLSDAQKAGILEDGVENYLHRTYEAETPWKQRIMAELNSGVLTTNPSLAKRRVFEYDMEAEQAGLRPIKSFIKRVAAYDLALNKAIADRKAVKEMTKHKMPDGRPMIDVAGRGSKVVDPTTGETSATMIDPGWKFSDAETPLKNRQDFKPFDHPAFRKWKWVTSDEGGKPVFVQGDVMVHPDAIGKINALLGPSRVRQSPIGRAALNAGATVKQTMLSVSLFHYTQIGVHGFEHRSFSPVREIDFTNPNVRSLIKGGLVVGETTGRGLFQEGLAGSSLTKYIPGFGPILDRLTNHLFESYIPRLKVNTGLHALERNKKKYPQLSEPEVAHMTANQMNAAFGGLNYEMMGRSKTTQDVLRLSLLAPDFLEARGRFAAQAHTKFGAEQRTALIYGLVGLYILARITNKITDDQYHFEPKNAFSVIHNGKAYGLRTVQGDLVHLGADPLGFMRNRLNPATVKPLIELAYKRDHFGRSRTFPEQLKDIAKTPIPISLKGLFEGREQTLMESLLNATGITEHRVSPSFEIYEKVTEWKEKNKIRTAPGDFVYDPTRDPFRNIKLAALHAPPEEVKEEIQAAIKSGIPYHKILKHFQGAAHAYWTGSKSNDRRFVASLSADERKTLAAARAEKLKIYNAVRNAR